MAAFTLSELEKLQEEVREISPGLFARHSEKRKAVAFQNTHVDQKNITGWKFRVSVHPDDVEAATHIICDLASDSHYAKMPFHMKVFDTALHQDASQQGKVITIYDAGDYKMETFLQELALNLSEAGIRAGRQAVGDRPISSDGGYFSLRYDGTKGGDKGQYAKAGEAYKPDDVADPFEKLDLRVDSVGEVDLPLGLMRLTDEVLKMHGQPEGTVEDAQTHRKNKKDLGEGLA